MNAQDLKNSILQRAIEGKLVPQRKEEGTAKELLAEIRAEKARLIKEKKIKKSKPLPEITDEEKPFDIPESWEWVRFEDIFEIARGGSPRPIKQFLTESDDGINWIKIGDTDIGGKYILCTKEKIIPEGLSKTKLVEPGDLLLTNSMSYGRPYILKTRGAIHDGWLVLSPYLKQTDKEFFYYVISSTYVHNEFARTVSGAVVKNLNKDKVKKIIVPLPPLAEQHRIVAKIEELQPDIDAYDKAQTKLQAIEQRFPDDMKKSLLQYAIEGKLVPQRKEEGTAKDLLAKIRAEKARLVKEKKIKKSKPLPAITDDEKPFDIPDSWEWVRLGEVSTYGQKINKIVVENMKPDMWLLDMEDIEKGTGRIIRHKLVKSSVIRGDKTVFHKGDLLYSKLRPYLKKILIAPEDGICTSELVPFQVYQGINPLYAIWWLNSPSVDQKVNAASYGVKMPRVGKETMINLLLPLPPLAEQRRIVAKLEEFLPLCQQLASHP